MIQGCRCLRRSTGRWLFSKNSTTRLEGLESWHGAGLLWNCSMPITNTKGSYLYPGSNTTPNRPRLQHLLPNGVMSVSHPPSIHPFFIFKPRHHAFPNAPLPSVKQLSCRMMTYSRPQTLLPNALRKTSCWMVLFSQIQPKGQSLPCTNFWCQQVHNFWGMTVFRGFFVSSCVICASDLNVCIFSSPVFGDLIRIFGYPPTLVPTVVQPKNNSRCHHRRGRRRETNQEDHHQDEDNGISHIPEPSNITDQEQRAKLEAS
jgi:hypothetical protein